MAETKMFLGRMDVGRYELTVLATTEKAALAAIRTAYRKAVKDDVAGRYAVPANEGDPLEYFGAHVIELTVGKAQWL